MERSLLGIRAVPTQSIENITKVLPPQRLPAIIHRTRLVDALQSNLGHRLTVVVAPAGYGKTTLVVDFVNSVDIPVCWLSLDEGDRDWQTFLEYLVAAVQQRFPAFGLEILSRLRQDAIGLRDADRLLGLLVTEMFSTIPDYFVIVLDDFHYLDDAPEVQALVEGLLNRLPENCHLIIASRTQPPLGNLPRLLVQRQAVRLGPTDLAFTREEVRRFFQDAQGMAISEEEAQQIVQATEGWAAGLILLAANPALLATPGSLQAHGLPADLFQYLANEVYVQQPLDVQSFLLRTSVLSDINADLCNGLLGIDDSERLLNLLEQRSLFLTRRQGVRPWYRYHPLFREFLLAKLKAEAPHELQHLHSRAGALQERAGQWGEAIRHYTECQDWEAVARVVEKGAHKIFEEGKWSTLTGWIEALPEEARRQRPRLALWWAKALYHLNQVDLALQKVITVIPQLLAREDWVAVGEALICRGASLRLKGKHEEAVASCKEARSLLLHHDCPASVVAEARKELGISYGMQGQFTQALEELNNALTVYEPQGDTYNSAVINDHIGITLSALGRLAEAAGYFEKARQGWLTLNNEAKLASTLNNMGMVFYLQGEYRLALDLFQESLQRARSVGERRVEAYALASLADIKREQGAYDAAIELYNQCQDLARSLQESFLIAYAIDGLGNAYRLLGDLGKAEVLVREAGAEAADKGALYELGLYQTSLGLIHRQRGEKEQAVVCFQEAASLLERSGAKREQARAYFHWAETLFSFGRKSRSRAMALLEGVATLVKELGYYHFLLADAAQAPLIVQYAAAKDVGDGLFRQLQARMMERSRATAEEVSAGRATGKLPVIAAHALGSTRVFIDNRAVTDLEWRSEKSREMFFYLLSQGKPLRKEQIVVALWPDLPEEKCNSSFHSSLHRLRRALYAECVVQDNGWYRLNPTGTFWYDAAKFQELINGAEEMPRGSEAWAEALQQAVDLYQGPFAEEIYSEWAETLRRQLEQKYLRALASLASYYASREEYEKSIGLCEKILAVDSLHEDGWYQMMSCYLSLGERGAALHCYRQYTELLQEELGVEPPPKVAHLYQRAVNN